MTVDELSPRETFTAKAPLLTDDGLQSFIEDQILADGLKERVESIWLHGSFADPNKEIDRVSKDNYAGPTSDIDVFIVLEGWPHPGKASGTLACFAGVPEAYEHGKEARDGDTWIGWDEWRMDAAEAFAQLTSAEQRTLRNTIGARLAATGCEREASRQRSVDVMLGNTTQFEAYTDADTRICLTG